MIRNIFWNVDGVLFDTYPAITYAISKSLNEMGESLALNVIDKLVRESMTHCVDTLSLRFKLDPKLLRDKFADAYRAIDPVNQPPFSGVRDVCKQTYDGGGLNIAIADQSLSSAQVLLERHELSPYFTDIFHTAQADSHKSNATIIFAALEKNALNPAQTLLVGKSDQNMRAGQEAGVRVCLYGNAHQHVQADIYISHYAQLLAKLSASQRKE